MNKIKWVIFDVGETLFSERRLYDAWADWLSVPRDVFWSALVNTILAGKDHREVFEVFRPGFDLARERAQRAEAGNPDALSLEDLYPDALGAIRAIASIGLKVGVAGNQPDWTSDLIAGLDAPIELIGMSETWQVRKPDPKFFQKIIELTGCHASEIAYVGDRIDNDVVPALSAGFHAIFIRQGHWALAANPSELHTDSVVDNLSELPALLDQISK